jgi:hypothetical protein
MLKTKSRRKKLRAKFNITKRMWGRDTASGKTRIKAWSLTTETLPRLSERKSWKFC